MLDTTTPKFSAAPLGHAAPELKRSSTSGARRSATPNLTRKCYHGKAQ
jgi:hypothetical protein